MKKAVLITTDKDKRGVFMGYIDPKDAANEPLVVKDVRMVVRWTGDVKGVIGLAANGPSSTCRVTAAAPKATIKGVTAVLEITKEAERNFKKEPWG